MKVNAEDQSAATEEFLKLIEVRREIYGNTLDLVFPLDGWGGLLNGLPGQIQKIDAGNVEPSVKEDLVVFGSHKESLKNDLTRFEQALKGPNPIAFMGLKGNAIAFLSRLKPMLRNEEFFHFASRRRTSMKGKTLLFDVDPRQDLHGFTIESLAAKFPRAVTRVGGTYILILDAQKFAEEAISCQAKLADRINERIKGWTPIFTGNPPFP